MQQMAHGYKPGGGRYYHHADTVTDGTSQSLVVPNSERVSVAVTPGTSARVEFTLSNYDAVEGGTATWLPWPAGDVTEVTADTISSSVTALRLVSTGASAWEVTV